MLVWCAENNNDVGSRDESPLMPMEYPPTPRLETVDLPGENIDGAEGDATIRSGEGETIEKDLLMHPRSSTMGWWSP